MNGTWGRGRLVTALLFWAGLWVAGVAAADCPVTQLTPLAQVKGVHEAPIPEGHRITVRGVVTADFLGHDRLNGFYVQSTDGPPVGIFVYAPRVPEPYRRSVQPGNIVQLRAQTDRFHGRIQLSRLDSLHLCQRDAAVEPLALSVRGSDQERWARLDGMLVTLAHPLVVTGNHELARYGSLELSPERRFRRTNTEPPPPRSLTLVLDDGSYRAFPDPAPYLDANGTRRVGTEVTRVTGVLTRAFDAWRIHPVQPPEFRDSNPRPEPPPSPDDRLRVAAFNVENYFLTLRARGARTAGDLELQRAKLAAAVSGLAPDVLALLEMENDRGALLDFLEEIHARTGIAYRALDAAANTGSDAIKVAVIYRPDRVRALGPAIADNVPVHHRPPIVGRFQDINGESQPFAVTAVHFKSKTRCPQRGDIDRGQGCWNQRRVEQAERLVEFLQELRDAEDVDQIMIAGDINAYGAEDPLRVLRAAGFRDLVQERLPEQARYTYIYRGESGYLDHLLVNEALNTRVDHLGIWHINADEPAGLGYRGLGNMTPTGDAFRSSDHDPVFADLRQEGGQDRAD